MALAYKTGCGITKSSATATTTTGAMTLGSTGAATGETIIVAVGTVNTTSNAPTDNATPSSNTYVQIATAVVNTEKITFWGCLSSKSAVTTVTATFTSSRYGVALTGLSNLPLTGGTNGVYSYALVFPSIGPFANSQVCQIDATRPGGSVGRWQLPVIIQAWSV